MFYLIIVKSDGTVLAAHHLSKPEASPELKREMLESMFPTHKVFEPAGRPDDCEEIRVYVSRSRKGAGRVDSGLYTWGIKPLTLLMDNARRRIEAMQTEFKLPTLTRLESHISKLQQAVCELLDLAGQLGADRNRHCYLKSATQIYQDAREVVGYPDCMDRARINIFINETQIRIDQRKAAELKARQA
jgi:hypothetical protein